RPAWSVGGVTVTSAHGQTGLCVEAHGRGRTSTPAPHNSCTNTRHERRQLDMAEIQISGNVGQSELKFTQGGSAYLRFSVAENHRKKTGNEWVDDGTTWWNITAWDKLAERLAEAVVKGARVVVTGTVRSREYEKD